MRSNLLLNEELDSVDSTGVMNYLHLTHAKPAEDHQTDYMVNSDAFTHVSIDA